jgi:hypothetical protein
LYLALLEQNVEIEGGLRAGRLRRVGDGLFVSVAVIREESNREFDVRDVKR